MELGDPEEKLHVVHVGIGRKDEAEIRIIENRHAIAKGIIYVSANKCGTMVPWQEENRLQANPTGKDYR